MNKLFTGARVEYLCSCSLVKRSSWAMNHIKNNHLLSSVISCSGRLYFTTFRGKPSKAPGFHFFNIDEEFVYQKWALWKFFCLVCVVHCTTVHPFIRHFTLLQLLLGLWPSQSCNDVPILTTGERKVKGVYGLQMLSTIQCECMLWLHCIPKMLDHAAVTCSLLGARVWICSMLVLARAVRCMAFTLEVLAYPVATRSAPLVQHRSRLWPKRRLFTGPHTTCTNGLMRPSWWGRTC